MYRKLESEEIKKSRDNQGCVREETGSQHRVAAPPEAEVEFCTQRKATRQSVEEREQRRQTRGATLRPTV